MEFKKKEICRRKNREYFEAKNSNRAKNVRIIVAANDGLTEKFFCIKNEDYGNVQNMLRTYYSIYHVGRTFLQFISQVKKRLLS
jgi:hypothetical protein